MSGPASGRISSQVSNQVLSQKISYPSLIKTAITTAVPIAAGQLSSVVAEMITQGFMADFGSEYLTALSWANAAQIAQSAIAAPPQSLYPVLGQKIGQAGEAGKTIIAIDLLKKIFDSQSANSSIKLAILNLLKRMSFVREAENIIETVGAIEEIHARIEKIKRPSSANTDTSDEATIPVATVADAPQEIEAEMAGEIRAIEEEINQISKNIESSLNKIRAQKESLGPLAQLPEIITIGATPIAHPEIDLNAEFNTAYDEQKTIQIEKQKSAQREIVRLGQQGIYYSLIASIPVALLFSFLGSALQPWFGQDREIASIAERFLRSYVLGLGFLAFNYAAALRPYLSVLGQRNGVTAVNLIGLPVMFLLSYCLGLGKFGCPNLGVEGLALARAARSWLNAIVCTGMVLTIKIKGEVKQGPDIHLIGPDLKLSEIFKFKISGSWSYMKEVLSMGIPIAGRTAIESVVSFFTSVFYGLISKNALTVASVTSLVSGLVLFPSISLSNAGAQLVGAAKGGNDLQKAYRVGNVCIGLAATWAALWCGMSYFVSSPIAEIFLDAKAIANSEVMYWLPKIMSLTLLGQFIDAFRIGASGALQGLTKEALWPMVYSCFGMGVAGLAISYGAGVRSSLGPYGVVLGTLGGTLISAGACLKLWFLRNSIQSAPIENPPIVRVRSTRSRTSYCSTLFCCGSRRPANTTPVSPNLGQGGHMGANSGDQRISLEQLRPLLDPFGQPNP